MRVRHVLATTALATALAGTAFAQGAGGGGGESGATTAQRPPQEEATGPGAIVTVAPSGVRLIQQRLNQIGYDAGNQTGSWDQKTGEAARRFQQANNLEPTGTLTISFLNCLGGTQGGAAILSGSYVGGGQGRSQRSPDEMGGSEGARLRASPAQIRMIQQRLNNLGYEVGNPTGAWDSKTAEAAKLFQQANNLEPTGRLDVALITAMNGNRLIFGEGCPGGGGATGTTTGQRFPQEATAGKGEPIYISPTSVRFIQQALNAAGWNAGNLTGAWDNQTQQAVARFEKANRLEPTGALTTSMLARLGMGNWYKGGLFRGPMAAGAGEAGRYGFGGGGMRGGGNVGAGGGGISGGGGNNEGGAAAGDQSGAQDVR